MRILKTRQSELTLDHEGRKLGSLRQTVVDESDYGVEKLGSDHGVEKLWSDHGVETLGSDHDVEKLGSDHGVEKLGSDHGVEIGARDVPNVEGIVIITKDF